MGSSSNLSTNLYNTLTSPSTMRTLLANYFNDSKTQAIALLQNNGVAIANSAPIQVVRVAWLKAIKDSASFRAQAAASLTNYITAVKAKVSGQSNFVGVQPIYYNDVTGIASSTNYIDPNSGGIQVDPSLASGASDTSSDTATLAFPLGATSLANTGATGFGASSNPNAVAQSMAATGSSGSGGGLFSALGSIFTPKVLQQGVTTGLQAYSTSLTAAANKTSEQNALQLEQLKLAQAQVAAQAPSSGLSTGWKIAIGGTIAAIVIIGVAVFVRKKRRA